MLPVHPLHRSVAWTLACVLGATLLASSPGRAPALTAAEARAVAADPHRILLEAASFDSREGPPPLAAALEGTRAAGPDYVIVQFRDRIDPTHRSRLEALGVDILEYIPNRAFLVRATPAAAAVLRADPGVQWVGLYEPAYRLSPAIGTRVFEDPRRAGDDHLWLTVDVFRGESAIGVADVIRSLGAEVLRIDDSAFVRRLQVRARPELLDDLARIRAVQWIEEWGEFTLRNNTTRWVVQTNISGLTTIWAHGIRGENQIVGHIDTRIKRDSCFFEDPVNNTPGPDHRKLVAYRSNSGFGQSSHGTHTGGTIAGDQEPLNGTIDSNGIAYHARISYSNLSDITGFGNTTSNLFEYFTFATLDDAHVHTNSWGDDGFTSYTTWARDIDLFSRAFEDDLVGFAVTNMSTLKTPENAKNVLAIGGTFQAPNQQQHYSGGRGPTADGRRKPEIYAPGRSIISARTTTCGTTSSSGTSMACPAVMGSAALVRQYYAEGWYPDGIANPNDAFVPTGALIKATLLNATVDMDPAGYPTDTEGWGRLLLEDSLFFDGDPRRLAAWDIRNADGLLTGEVREFEFEVTSPVEPLRVTLVFTDEAAALGAAFTPVNDLDLEVELPFTGVTYKGNVLQGGWSVPGGAADPLNNVEMVMLQFPGPARYTVRVAATQVVGDPQGFAVVVTGDLAGATAALADRPASPAAAARPLLAVRPNPFNPETALDYRLPAAGEVELAIYDPAGRLVRGLVSGGRQAGLYRTRWDGRDQAGETVSSGVYVARLRLDGRELARRKVVLLK